MDQNLFNLIIGIMTLLIATGGVCLINFLNNKIGNDKVKSYYELAKNVVMAMEQVNPQLAGIDKKDLAVNKLIQLTNNKITQEQADVLIESAVYEVKKVISNNIK